jgi:sialate O-acetylesterase
MHKARRWLVALCASISLASFSFASTPTPPSGALLDEMFQDHAVLQRDRPIPIWGRAQPNEEISIEFNATSVATRADENGKWRLELPAHSAGGPFELSARGSSGASQTIKDVLVGDVWLCSGQSNMEMQVRASLNGFFETRMAANGAIRLLTVAKDTSLTPLEDFKTPVRWQAASSDSVADFSAVCFFFARELRKHVDVPMGLIHSSWGGSKIEPWMSADALRAAGGFDDRLEIVQLAHSQPRESVRRWGELWEGWWLSKMPNERPWLPKKTGEWRKAPDTLGHWEQWGAPELAQFNGMVWFRADVRLTAKQAAQTATLKLGRVDDADVTWVNGKNVGSTAGPEFERAYELPPGVLKAGDNAIVVNVLDVWAFGGMIGPSESRVLELGDGTKIALDGRWEYRIAPTSIGEPPRAPWESTAGLTIIGNAMIAPLGNYQMRGVLWYQGESNTGDGARYDALLAHWIADWRARFGADAAMLIVQLANYGQPPSQPVESGWAEVRDAQRRAVANDARAGLAVTVDLGDRWDIHPANKQQVGYRLARAARHAVYGEAITPSGPAPVRAHRQGEVAVVEFTDIDGTLRAFSHDRPIGFELCGPAANSCRYALAEIDGSKVRLIAPNAQEATRVRYCWADSPVCTLYDAELPASPFELKLE